MRMPGSGMTCFAALFVTVSWVLSPIGHAASLDQLSDLTGKVMAIVTLKGRDNFTSEYRYDVSVRNNSSDSFIADSLVLVLDKVTNLAGEDREPLKNESFLQRFEVLDQDGETDDGKPFFRVPTGSSPDLAPHSDSRAATVRLRNKDYVAVFTPSFRVLGLKRPPAKPKPPEPSPQISENTNAIDKLLQLLVKKGIITDEEAKSMKRP